MTRTQQVKCHPIKPQQLKNIKQVFLPSHKQKINSKFAKMQSYDY